MVACEGLRIWRVLLDAGVQRHHGIGVFLLLLLCCVTAIPTFQAVGHCFCPRWQHFSPALSAFPPSLPRSLPPTPPSGLPALSPPGSGACEARHC